MVSSPQCWNISPRQAADRRGRGRYRQSSDPGWSSPERPGAREAVSGVRGWARHNDTGITNTGRLGDITSHNVVCRKYDGSKRESTEQDFLRSIDFLFISLSFRKTSHLFLIVLEKITFF